MKKPKQMPNRDQLEALIAFAMNNGPRWKDELMKGWLYAKYPGELQQVRNQFGPSWLSKTSLAAMVSAFDALSKAEAMPS